MSALDLADPQDYALFLNIQLAARAPIERWASRHAEPDLRPPEVVALLKADLAALGITADVPESRFEPGPTAHALGLAWAIAGSHLGNRALLARLRERGAALPKAFLGDPRMPLFWKRIRPRIEAPATQVPVAGALVAANAVFACFVRALDNCEGKLAA